MRHGVIHSNAFAIFVLSYIAKIANDNKINSNATEHTKRNKFFGANFPIAEYGSISCICHPHPTSTPFIRYIRYSTYIFRTNLESIYWNYQFVCVLLLFLLFLFLSLRSNGRCVCSIYVFHLSFHSFFLSFFVRLPKYRLSSGMRMLPFCRR